MVSKPQKTAIPLAFEGSFLDHTSEFEYLKALMGTTKNHFVRRTFKLRIVQGRQHEFQSGGAKTQPIFICYNFCFEMLNTWKNSF